MNNSGITYHNRQANNDQLTMEHEQPHQLDLGTPSKTIKPNQQSIQTQQSQAQKILTFILCLIVIYFCQILYGIIQQRIYKVPYDRTHSSNKDFYTDPLSPMLISALFAATIGYLRLQEHEIPTEIPFTKLLKIALLQIVIHFSLMWALMHASYILVVMVNSCGLLSVIIVSVYFSKKENNTSYQPNDQIQNQQNQQRITQRVNQRENSRSHSTNSKKTIGPQKILICAIVCIGIFIFNYFTPKKTDHSSETNQSASLLAFVVLALAVVLQGFRPEMQSQIKRVYEPSALNFYYNYHRVLCVVVLIVSMVTWKLPYTVRFIMEHDQLFLHIIGLGLSNAVSAIFIYKIISIFRQHVYPLVSTVRKCITVGVSIVYFGHRIQILQIVGIVLVFGGVMLEISTNYRLLQKWGMDLGMGERNERYVKNREMGQDGMRMRKRYEVYKIVDKEGEVEGI